MTKRARALRQRGVTLLELMMSLVMIVSGLLVIFRTLASSVAGTQTSTRAAQAQERAATIIEAIRLSPDPAILCLRNTPSINWQACETTCQQSQTIYATVPASVAPSTCIYTTDGTGMQGIKGPYSPKNGTTTLDQTVDRQGQTYFTVTGVAPANAAAPVNLNATYVRLTGEGPRTLEVVVSVGWNDDNSNTQIGAGFPNHRISLATGVYR